MVHIQFRGHCIEDHEPWPCKQMTPPPVPADVEALAQALEGAERYEQVFLDRDPVSLAHDIIDHLPVGWRFVQHMPPSDFGSQVISRGGLPDDLAARIDAIEGRK